MRRFNGQAREGSLHYAYIAVSQSALKKDISKRRAHDR